MLLESQRRDDRQLMPTDNEISTAEELVAVLEAFNDATEIVSGEKYPTLGIVKPLFHKLLSSTLAAKDTENAPRVLRGNVRYQDMLEATPCTSIIRQ